MVRPVHDDDAPAARPGARHAESELVGLASGADEEADRERAGQRGGQALGIAHDRGMQVPRVRVQHRHLSLPGRDDPGVRVADVGDVVHHVEKRPARVVEEERPGAADDLDRRTVGERQGGPEAAAALLADPLGVLGGRPERRPGKAEDEVGIGREREPDGAFARCADAVEIAVAVEHVRHDLKVDVGRPVPVAGRRADRADALAAGHGRARSEPRQRVRRQVPVESVEARRAFRRVLEDHGRPVVEARGIVAQRVDAARQRREDGRSGRHEDVDRDVHGATFGVLARRAGEGVSAVHQARLVVASDPDLRARLAHPCEEAWRHRGGRQRFFRRAELGARNREVEHDGLREVRTPDDRMHLPAVRRQPRLDRGRLGAGNEAAGVSEHVLREARVHLAHLRERFPRRCLADEEILVVWLGRAAVGREADARAEPKRRQRPQRLELRIGERPRRVIAGGHTLGRRQRVGLAERGVGGGDRQLADRPGLDHVPEIEDPGDRPVAGRSRRGADEEVVVVGVVVDDAAGKAPQHRTEVRLGEAGEVRDQSRGAPGPRSRRHDAR